MFTGILGGFTTFSTFANDSVSLLRQGQGSGAFLNVTAHVVLGLAAVWLVRVAASLIRNQ